MRRIGMEIRRVRQERGLTQWQLSVMLGITPGRMLLIERGEGCSNDLMMAIAEALGVSVAELYGKQ